MSISFSRAQIKGDKQDATFLVGGSPKTASDLQGWTAFEQFMNENDRIHSYQAKVEIYLYEEDTAFDADIYEVAYINKRMEQNPDFIEQRTTKECKYQIAICHFQKKKNTAHLHLQMSRYYIPRDDIANCAGSRYRPCIKAAYCGSRLSLPHAAEGGDCIPSRLSVNG